MKEEKIVSGRFRYSGFWDYEYWEEMRMLNDPQFRAQMLAITKSAEESLKPRKDTKVGTAIWVGTGGDLTTLKQAEDMFRNPDNYSPDKYFVPRHYNTDHE